MKPKRTKRRPAVQVRRLQVHGQPVLLVSFPTPAQAFAQLTAAERQIAALLIAGKKNRDIATARSTTVRTVNKQIESLYAKLKVGSRAQLALLLSRA